MKHNKTNAKEESMIISALQKTPQPEPDAALDKMILSEVQARLQHEQQEKNALLFTRAIDNPNAANNSQLPATVVQAVAVYQLIAQHIAADKALSTQDIAYRQQALVSSMAEAIREGSVPSISTQDNSLSA